MNGIFNERQVLMSFLLLRIKLWYHENEAQEIAHFAMPMITAISTLKKKKKTQEIENICYASDFGHRQSQ
jgi:hypothetical protein